MRVMYIIKEMLGHAFSRKICGDGRKRQEATFGTGQHHMLWR